MKHPYIKQLLDGDNMYTILMEEKVHHPKTQFHTIRARIVRELYDLIKNDEVRSALEKNL